MPLLSKFICEDVDSNVIVWVWTNYVLVILESRRRLNGFFLRYHAITELSIYPYVAPSLYLMAIAHSCLFVQRIRRRPANNHFPTYEKPAYLCNEKHQHGEN